MGSDRERVVSTQRPTAVQSFFPFSQPAPTPPRDCPVINGPSPFDIRLLQPRDKRTGIADTPRQLRRSVPPDDGLALCFSSSSCSLLSLGRWDASFPARSFIHSGIN